MRGQEAVGGINAMAVRTAKLSKEDANLLGGLDLDESRMDTIPDQIRNALRKSLVRVIDLFRQFDDDESGCVNAFEFNKAIQELGCFAPPEAVAAVFSSFDPDGSGSIEFCEMHTLLVRSMQAKPHLEPLTLKATNQVGLRTSKIHKKDANLLAGLDLDESRMDEIPDQIRIALQQHRVRVMDLFYQMDDDKSGYISGSEFLKAMSELGLHEAPREAVAAVFASFDLNGNGVIEYDELRECLVRSFQQVCMCMHAWMHAWMDG